MNVSEVFEQIDKLKDKYINMLVDICNIESKSDDKDGVDRVGNYLCAVAEEMGYTVKKKEFENAGNVYSFTLNPDGIKRQISVSGHMDTVFEKGVFGYPPTRIEGDFIYGPGVQDCKGGIVMCLLVMEALKNCGYDERPVKLILQSDEEVNSVLSDKGTLDFMVQEAKGSVAFINAEGHAKGRITVGRKGIAKRKIIIEGRACHAGACTDGINAVKEAAYKIIELEKDSDANGITFNCGVVNGGTVSNIVPERCEIELEYRFKTLEQKKEADEKFDRIVNTSYVDGTKSYAVELSTRIPMERTAENERLAKVVSDVSVKYGFGELKMSESAGGADAAYTTYAKIPTVDSVGPEGAYCHSTRERAVLSSIPRLAKLMAAVIMECPDEI